jgi:uncharacterized YccA/Bax inhibitor family protein
MIPRSLLRGESIYKRPVMLKELIKNAGLLIILIGVIILAVVVFSGVQTNSLLGLSLGLVIGGLLAHILINRFVD